MDTPEDWDAFAGEYAAIQRESRLPIAADTSTFLNQRGLLQQQTVLDLAAGSGRYSIFLAKYAQKVVLNDWSKAMLQEAKALVAEKQLQNVTYLQTDWHQLPQKLADLVFISQLPNLDAAMLPQFETLANRMVIINLQIAQCEPLLNKLSESLKLAPLVNPQVHPNAKEALTQKLVQIHRRFFQHQFTYTLNQQTTISELLPRFDRPFGAVAAQSLAEDLHLKSSQQVVTQPVTYTFWLLGWRIP